MIFSPVVSKTFLEGTSIAVEKLRRQSWRPRLTARLRFNR
jgi:hypothetical protein